MPSTKGAVQGRGSPRALWGCSVSPPPPGRALCPHPPGLAPSQSFLLHPPPSPHCSPQSCPPRAATCRRSHAGRPGGPAAADEAARKPRRPRSPSMCLSSETGGQSGRAEGLWERGGPGRSLSPFSPARCSRSGPITIPATPTVLSAIAPPAAEQPARLGRPPVPIATHSRSSLWLTRRSRSRASGLQPSPKRARNAHASSSPPFPVALSWRMRAEPRCCARVLSAPRDAHAQ